MNNLKVIFMGTPEFSVPILNNLIANTNVIMVVTSPDAYIGRKKILTPCPVKKLALDNSIPVFSPNKIRNEYQMIIDAKPDIIITCAYGQIIPKILIDLPRLGCINIHASLLPRYRGGAPIQRAIMDGEEYTGITLMYMDEGMDSGDIIYSEKIKIEENDNLETLSNKLSLLGSEMIINHLPTIIEGSNQRIKQDVLMVTFAPIIKREDEKIDFNNSTEKVYNHIRSLTTSPYGYFIVDGVEYKIIEFKKTVKCGDTKTIKTTKDSIIINTIDGGIEITKFKPFGKNIMNIKDFFNGFSSEKFEGVSVE